jgi:chemotaxis protein CheD
MNHFLLPGDASQDTQSMKYGVHAIELLINELLKLGAQRAGLEAKVFGGASVSSASFGKIGHENGVLALDILRTEGIPVISQSLGGSNARRIRFWPTTGQARQMLVPANEFHIVELPDKPAAPNAPGDISLF